MGSVLYGYIVNRTGSYDAPFIPMAVLLLVGAALWVNVDASRELGGEPTQAFGDSAKITQIVTPLVSGVAIKP